MTRVLFFGVLQESRRRKAQTRLEEAVVTTLIKNGKYPDRGEPTWKWTLISSAALNVSARVSDICVLIFSASWSVNTVSIASTCGSKVFKIWQPTSSSSNRTPASPRSVCRDVLVKWADRSIVLLAQPGVSCPRLLEGGLYGTAENSARMRVYRYTVRAPDATQYARKWNCIAQEVVA